MITLSPVLMVLRIALLFGLHVILDFTLGLVVDILYDAIFFGATAFAIYKGVLVLNYYSFIILVFLFMYLLFDIFSAVIVTMLRDEDNDGSIK